MEKIATVLEIRNDETLVMVEFVSSLINSQLSELRRIVIAELERSVLAAFDNDDFFICTNKTLKYWMQIIKCTVEDSKDDILARYLSKVAFTSYWSSEENKNKTRIKSFSRVCFIIFSGEVDKFMTKDKTKVLLEKIKEVLKDPNAHPSLISLVDFLLNRFCSRSECSF